MITKFTKKDKRTNLEKEIDSVLDVMDKMKRELEYSSSENLDEQIDSLLETMSKVDQGSEDYLNMVKALETLYKAKASVKSKLEEYSEMTQNLEKLLKARDNSKQLKIPVKTVLWTAGFTLVELLCILHYEKADVITSKAFSRLTKVRL